MTTGWNGFMSYPMPDGANLAQRVFQVEQSVSRLAEQVERLERQLEEIRSRPPMHIEYHFDQLKVNELKGTLNVGLSPQGATGIDAFELPPDHWPVAASPEAAAGDGQIERLQQQMTEYMDQTAPANLGELEQRFGIPLEPAHRQRLLADIKRQLPERVRYYASVIPCPTDGAEAERQRWHQSVIDKTTRDIQDAFAAYLKRLKQQHHAKGDGTS